MKSILFCLSLTTAALAQAPAFEVATIRQTSETVLQAITRGSNPMPAVKDDRFHAGPLTLRSLIIAAYRIESHQLVGPAWLESPTATTFEVDAKLPADTTAQQMPQMLQQLLAERFKLVIDRGTKDVDVQAIVVGRNGPKFESKLEPAPGKPTLTMGAAKIFMSGPVMRLETNSVTGILDYLKTNLAPEPIVDRTALTGTYDIRIDFPPVEMPAGPPSGPAMKDAALDRLRRGLNTVGLSLDQAKAPVPTIIVTSVEKAPTEN